MPRRQWTDEWPSTPAATLATKRTLLLTWAGLPPAGPHQLCLAHSFDHLIGAGDQSGRDFKTKCFGGFKVDDQLVFGWLLDRQIAGRFALENTINVRRCSLEQIDYVWSITDESAGLCEQVEWIDRRKSKLSRKRDEQFTMSRCEWIRKNNYTTTRSLHENTKPMINLARVACTNH